MSKNISTQNLKNASSESLDWTLIQRDMKSKLEVIYMKVGLEK